MIVLDDAVYLLKVEAVSIEFAVKEEDLSFWDDKCLVCDESCYMIGNVFEIGILALTAALETNLALRRHESNASQAVVFALDETGKLYLLIGISRLILVKAQQHRFNPRQSRWTSLGRFKALSPGCFALLHFAVKCLHLSHCGLENSRLVDLSFVHSRFYFLRSRYYVFTRFRCSNGVYKHEIVLASDVNEKCLQLGRVSHF